MNNNYRILLVTNCLSFGTAGIYLPLMTLYLQGLGADLALISIILTSSAALGLAAAALGYVWLSQRTAWAWPGPPGCGMG